MSIDLRFRNKITFEDVAEESNAVTTDMVSVWFKTALSTLMSNHNLRDILNAEEFGLFYQALPGKNASSERREMFRKKT